MLDGDNNGYWLAAADGGVFRFGNATNYGNAIGRTRFKVVGIAGTPSGKGYWLLNTRGEILRFGDAGAYGHAGSLRLGAPMVAIARTPTGKGYWLVSADGSVYAFGDAKYRGGTYRRSFAPFMGIAWSARPATAIGSSPRSDKCSTSATRHARVGGRGKAAASDHGDRRDQDGQGLLAQRRRRWRVHVRRHAVHRLAGRAAPAAHHPRREPMTLIGEGSGRAVNAVTTAVASAFLIAANIFVLLAAAYFFLGRGDLPSFFPHASHAGTADSSNDVAMAAVMLGLAGACVYGTHYAQDAPVVAPITRLAPQARALLIRRRRYGRS